LEDLQLGDEGRVPIALPPDWMQQVGQVVLQTFLSIDCKRTLLEQKGE
jgi:hypothetical protein